jgi:hypothetical protein
MIAHARQNRLSFDSVENVYLKGNGAIKEHNKRNGYGLQLGPNGMMSSQQRNTNDVAGPEVDALKDFIPEPSWPQSDAPKADTSRGETEGGNGGQLLALCHDAM